MMVCASARSGSALTAALASSAADSISPACMCRLAATAWRRASLRRLLDSLSLKVYSGATLSMSRREASGLTKLSREQALVANTSTAASRIGSRQRIGASLLQPLAELRLATGAVHHLALELAAGGVDVVAAGAPHRRDAAGLVEQLLEAADGRVVGALVARDRGRIEREQADLGRRLPLPPGAEVAHPA